MTDLPLLATPQMLADHRGVAFDETDFHAVQLLAEASALIRNYTRQTITQVLGDEIVLDGDYSTTLVLPELPVTDVTKLETLESDATWTEVDTTSYSFSRAGVVTYTDGWPSWPYYSRFPSGVQNIRVTYDHGYETIPDDIRHACVQIAARLYLSTTVTVSGTAGAVTQQSETIGGYSYDTRYDTASATTTVGVSGLTPQEQISLDRYRRVVVV